MTRMPRVRPILVLAALLVLIVAPMASARTVDYPSIHPAGDSWIGAALHWVESLAGPRHPDHSGSKVPHTKAVTQPQGSGCVDPTGRPKPCL